MQKKVTRTEVPSIRSGLMDETARLTLGEKIRHLRRMNRLSQWDLADAVGVHANTIRNWEGGSTVPDELRLARICRTFGIARDDIAKYTPDGTEELPTLALRLRQFRLQKLYSQMELAQIIGSHPSVINNFERGRRSPTLPMLLRIAEALGISVGAFFDATAHDSTPPQTELCQGDAPNDEELEKCREFVASAKEAATSMSVQQRQTLISELVSLTNALRVFDSG